MIKFEDYIMDAASMGDLNPMPDIKNVSYIHAGYEATPEVKADLKYLGKGMIPTMLPYKLQDGYDRDRKPRAFKAAILENDYVKAVFLPELGGRLWSLYDKELKRELLYVNSVFQPGNLGLRNAWFSGGVEFNVGIKGHNPLTASPLWCEVCETEDGEILNLYEFERIRGVVFTVSAYLPDDSHTLYLKCRIENNTDDEKYMYWWSNIAVPETDKTRIIVPTDDSYLCFYNADHYDLGKAAIPYSLGTDVSYPSNLSASHDFFYKIKKDESKWIATAEEDGVGLLQCSTDRLYGRKLFIWGQGAGGRNWNEWLSEEGQAYIEIQAGLANTQLEHIPMPARCEWSWTEAYTALNCPPEKLHSKDWNEAVTTVSEYLKNRVGDTHTLTYPDDSKVKSRRIIYTASRWGSIEEMKRGEKLSRYHDFPCDPSDPETAEWYSLISDNNFPDPDICNEPSSYVSGEYWETKLASAPESWYKYLQLGVTQYAQGKVESAHKSWEKSLEIKESAWALRNISMLYKNEYGDIEKAREYIFRAYRLKPDSRALAVEVAMVLTAAERHEELVGFYDSLIPGLKAHGRLRLYKAQSLIKLDRTDEAMEIVNPDFEMSDIKEGELSISHIWFILYRRVYEKKYGIRDDDAADKMYPLPKKLDFRMHVVKK